MKQILILLVLVSITFGCSNNSEKEKLLKKIKQLEWENKELKSHKKDKTQEEEIDKTPKNYVKRKIENVEIYIPGLVEVEEAGMEYTKDYDDMYAYLNVKVKNGLNRNIKSVLLHVETVDCDENKIKFISANVDIPKNSTKSVRVNIHSQIQRNYRMNCYQHSPIVKVSEVLLSTNERYLNIESID